MKKEFSGYLSAFTPATKDNVPFVINSRILRRILIESAGLKLISEYCLVKYDVHNYGGCNSNKYGNGS